jgi:hypothetical protein
MLVQKETVFCEMLKINGKQSEEGCADAINCEN